VRCFLETAGSGPSLLDASTIVTVFAAPDRDNIRAWNIRVSISVDFDGPTHSLGLVVGDREKATAARDVIASFLVDELPGLWRFDPVDMAVVELDYDDEVD